MKYKSFLFLAIYWLVGCTSTGKQELPVNDAVSLDKMIGQMLMAGFRGTTLSTHSHILKDIRRYHLGGVILYEYDVPSKTRPRNIESAEQLGKLINTLKDVSETPLFIAIDEEGGRVSRLKSTYGFPKGRSAQFLGELNNADSTRYWSGQIAGKLKANGINLNFAPVVDVNVNPASPAIGNLERSFSNNPERVAFHAALAVDAHRKDSVLTCLKHFPGHGSAATDSHLGFTDVSDTWSEIELDPYKRLIASGHCDMIMTAHVFNSNLDSIYPATLSSKVLKNILRDQLGWHGVVVSDDMQMGAISEHFGLETAIENAINGGVDILVFSNNIPGQYDEDIVAKAFNTIKSLVESGKISKERITLSYRRIAALKQKLP